MAMAFAPLAIKLPLKINDAGVVSKSYPSFWEDMKTSGFQVIENSRPKVAHLLDNPYL